MFSLSRNLRLFQKPKCPACVGAEYQPNRNLQFSAKEAIEVESYRTLGIRSGSDQEEVRRAFLALCKQYHPDSAGPEADTQKFQEIEQAYRNLQAKFISERWDAPVQQEEAEEFDIKHTAPQHRQYLSGVARPDQLFRRRTHDAAERVRQHRLKGVSHTGDALTAREKDKTKKGLGMERVVENLILESMAKGEFDNLKGAGKPIKDQDCGPHVDLLTQKMNQIMKDNGFTPEWITLRQEISEDTGKIRAVIREKCHLLNSEDASTKVKSEMEENVRLLNKKIELFNLKVPILSSQLLLFGLDEEIRQAVAQGYGKKRAEPEKDKAVHNYPKNGDSLAGLVSKLFQNAS